MLCTAFAWSGELLLGDTIEMHSPVVLVRVLVAVHVCMSVPRTRGEIHDSEAPSRVERRVPRTRVYIP